MLQNKEINFCHELSCLNGVIQARFDSLGELLLHSIQNSVSLFKLKCKSFTQKDSHFFVAVYVCACLNDSQNYS